MPGAEHRTTWIHDIVLHLLNINKIYVNSAAWNEIQETITALGRCHTATNDYFHILDLFKRALAKNIPMLRTEGPAHVFYACAIVGRKINSERDLKDYNATLIKYLPPSHTFQYDKHGTKVLEWQLLDELDWEIHIPKEKIEECYYELMQPIASNVTKEVFLAAIEDQYFGSGEATEIFKAINKLNPTLVKKHRQLIPTLHGLPFKNQLMKNTAFLNALMGEIILFVSSEQTEFQPSILLRRKLKKAIRDYYRNKNCRSITPTEIQTLLEFFEEADLINLYAKNTESRFNGCLIHLRLTFNTMHPIQREHNDNLLNDVAKKINSFTNHGKPTLETVHALANIVDALSDLQVAKQLTPTLLHEIILKNDELKKMKDMASVYSQLSHADVLKLPIMLNNPDLFYQQIREQPHDRNILMLAALTLDILTTLTRFDLIALIETHQINLINELRHQLNLDQPTENALTKLFFRSIQTFPIARTTEDFTCRFLTHLLTSLNNPIKTENDYKKLANLYKKMFGCSPPSSLYPIQPQSAIGYPLLFTPANNENNENVTLVRVRKVMSIKASR